MKTFALLTLLAQGVDPSLEPLPWLRPPTGMTDGAIIMYPAPGHCWGDIRLPVDPDAARRAEQARRRLAADAEMNAAIRAYAAKQGLPASDGAP